MEQTKYSFDRRGDLIIEHARISGRNFDGNKFGIGGAKGFCVQVDDPEWANQLQSKGWNVKVRPSQDPDGEPYIFFPVAINFNEMFHPNIYMYTSRNKIQLENQDCKLLNGAVFENIDLVIHGRGREDPTTHEFKVKAFLKSGHFTIEDDPFAEKYADYDRNKPVLSNEEDNNDPF